MPKKSVFLDTDGIKKKKCSDCAVIKPLTDYYNTRTVLKNGEYAPQGKCKVCYKVDRRNRYARQKNHVINIIQDE